MRKIITIPLLFLTIILKGINYYVSPSGSNSNTGSLTSPFNTISYGQSKLKAGDILYVRTGTYNEKLSIYSDNGVNGTETSPISILAYPGETPIIDGSAITMNEGSGLVMIWRSWVIFSGFTVQMSNQNGSYGAGGSGIQSIGAHNVISRCEVTNCWVDGISVGGDYSIVEYCSVSNACLSNSDGIYSSGEFWGEGITARHDELDGITESPIIRHNTVHDVWGEGIGIAFCNNATVEENIIYDSYSVALYVRNSQNGKIQRNLVYNTHDMGDGSRVGIGYWNEGNNIFVNKFNIFTNNIVFKCNRNFYSYDQMLNVVLENNTFVNSTDIACVQINLQGASGCEYRNNITIQDDDLPCMSVSSGSGIQFSNNLYNKSYSTSAAGSGDIIGDPLFLKAGQTRAGMLTGEYFKLQSTSPAINKGTAVNGVITDYFGIQRDANPDIGAYEYTGGSQAIKVTGITVTGAGGKQAITTDKGTLQITATVAPSTATDNTVKWSLSNGTGSATISSSGLMTAVSNGTVTAKAMANDGSGVYGTLTITISNQAAPPAPSYMFSAIQNVTPSLLEITFDISLANIIPSVSSFKVMVNSATRTINSAAISGQQVFLTLSSPVVNGDAVTVAYTKPTSNPLQTSAGGLSQSFSAQPVSNNCSLASNKPPVINISSPGKGVSFSAPANISINASASDPDGTIKKVEFYQGTVKLGEIATAPFFFVWKDVAAGSYSLTAVATDNLNSTGVSAPITVSVTTLTSAVNQHPVVTITSPANGQSFLINAPVNITIDAYDPDGSIKNVNYYNGLVKIGESLQPPYSVVFNSATPGTYNLRVVAMDYNNDTTSVSLSLNLIKSDENKDLLTLYPNPNSGKFTLSTSATMSDGTYKFSVISSQGKIVYKTLLKKDDINGEYDLTYLDPGLYILVLAINDILCTKKFLKN